MCIIWSLFYIFCVLILVFNGRADLVTSSIANSSKNAIENMITISANIIFWSAMLNIAINTKIIKRLSKIVYRFFSFLFRKDEVGDKAKEYISLNIASNMLGVGNAATVNNIKAMEELQKENINPKKLNKSMATLILLNTSSISIIPTSMITLRTLYGSSNPSIIILPVITISIISLTFSLILLNILWRFYD